MDSRKVKNFIFLCFFISVISLLLFSFSDITVEPMYSDTQPISLEQLDVGNSETPATVLEKEPEENNVEYVLGENSSVNNDYFQGDEMDSGVINDEHDDGGQRVLHW